LNVARLDYGNPAEFALLAGTISLLERVERLVYLKRELGTENVKLTNFC
jgi:hypothetical protein